MKEIQNAVEQLADDVHTFKSGYEARLKNLENFDVMSKRPEFDQKMGGMMTHEDQLYKTAFSSYLRKGDDQNLQNLTTKALSVGSDTDGGYLVPALIETHITDKIKDLSPLRRLANVLKISTSAVDMLVDRNSVMEAGWASETEERLLTDTSKLTKIKIPVHELYARPRATQKLLDDSMIHIEDWLASRIAARMTQLESMAFIQGDGVNKPKGILNYPTCNGSSWQWGQFEELITGVSGGFAETNPSDILISLLNTLKVEYLKGAVWLMSRSAHAAVKHLKDNNGAYIWQNGTNTHGTPTLLGYPIEIAEEMPDLKAGTDSKSIIFGNFKEAYQIVDHNHTTVLRDPYTAKPYVEFYTVKRVGGDVINFEALKIINFKKFE